LFVLKGDPSIPGIINELIGAVGIGGLAHHASLMPAITQFGFN
jgi:hypothetical protein